MATRPTACPWADCTGIALCPVNGFSPFMSSHFLHLPAPAAKHVVDYSWSQLCGRFGPLDERLRTSSDDAITPAMLTFMTEVCIWPDPWLWQLSHACLFDIADGHASVKLTKLEGAVANLLLCKLEPMS